MDDRTLTALRGSIAKWEGIVKGTMEDRGTKNCPLCHMYHPMHKSPLIRLAELEGCYGCPVAERTGEHFCKGSPHEQYVDADPGSELEKQLAVQELEFLKSLVPEGEKP